MVLTVLVGGEHEPCPGILVLGDIALRDLCRGGGRHFRCRRSGNMAVLVMAERSRGGQSRCQRSQLFPLPRSTLLNLLELLGSLENLALGLCQCQAHGCLFYLQLL